jgi:hypothetical protein
MDEKLNAVDLELSSFCDERESCCVFSKLSDNVSPLLVFISIESS